MKMQGMIFAAGLGTRLYPITKDTPKALIVVGGKTMLERVIDRMKDFGICEITVNVHHHADKMIAFLKKKDFGCKINVSEEKEMILDTGGGLLKAWQDGLLNKQEPILVHNVDVLSDLDLRNLFDNHLKSNNEVTLCVKERQTKRYLLFDNENRLSGRENLSTNERTIVRQSDKLTPYAFSGIHIVNPRILEKIDQRGKFSILDCYLHLCSKEKIGCYLDKESNWLDIGKPETLKAAEQYFSKTNIGQK